MNENRNKADKLNILRFAAFMMIFLLHSTAYMPYGWEQMPYGWLMYTPAWAGTWIFFILAGYGVGASLYSGKYDPLWERGIPFHKTGIVGFYIRRLKVIVPPYWRWILCVAFFVQSDILRPGPTHIKMLVKLFLFDYHEEFCQETFGVAWYITTLIRLYLLAPVFYYLMKRFFANKKQVVTAMLVIIFLFLGLRAAMWHHYRVDPPDMWSVEVYKPFWFNIDLFVCGMAINHTRKQKTQNVSKIHDAVGYAATVLLLMLSVVSAYFYYRADMILNETTAFMDVYRYILPSVYLLLCLIYIYCFDIRRTYGYDELSLRSIARNPLRLFDCFRLIQYPMYLFHPVVMYCLKEVYIAGMYNGTLHFLGLSQDNYVWAQGLFFILYAFVLTMLLSIAIKARCF